MTAKQTAVGSTSARFVYSESSSEHVCPLPCDLQWLQVPQRIEFCLTVLVFRCLNGSAPRYLADELRHVADIEWRKRTFFIDCTAGYYMGDTQNHRWLRFFLCYRETSIENRLVQKIIWRRGTPSMTSITTLLHDFHTGPAMTLIYCYIVDVPLRPIR